MNRTIVSALTSAFILLTASVLPAQTKPSAYKDPVNHAAITQPYKIAQDLEELTARIDNLYRKPLAKLFDKDGIVQPETIYFKDTTTGHEVMGLTRELCSDIAHGGLGHTVWSIDGRHIMFMGSRAYIDDKGKLNQSAWDGHKYIMNADYTQQRALILSYVDKDGKVTSRATGIDGKFNIFDERDPRYVYYAIKDKLIRVTLTDAPKDCIAESICELSNSQRKFIRDISSDGKIIIQDVNADLDKTTKKPQFMPEFHLIDLTKKPGEKGYYSHHAFDYGLGEVKDPATGAVVHAADNNYQIHGVGFGKVKNTIAWSYGPMTEVGEPLGWTLDITDGLEGVPTHGKIEKGSGRNPWSQYESHGKMLADTTLGLYFGGPIKLDGKDTGGWGLWIRDYSDDAKPPKFIMTSPGGHVAGGNSRNPDIWAAFIAAEWRDKVKESDGIAWGRTETGKGELLCYTYSDLRGGLKKDRRTGAVTWTGMNNNDARPYSSIPRPLISPDATKVWFHSAMLMPYDEWCGAYVVVTQRPEPPRDLVGYGHSKGIILAWKRAKHSMETKGFRVYRSDADGKDFRELTTGAVRDYIEEDKVLPDERKYTYTDLTAQADKTYTYAVTSEEWSGLESDTTSNTLVITMTAAATYTSKPGDPIKGWDKTPPPAVTGFAVAKEADEDGQYRLKWDASPAKDLRYYNIYFSTKGKPEVSQKRLIMSPLANMTGYLDWSAPLDAKEVYYAITAVDRQGNESAPAYAELKSTK
ncbi:MAG: fibronectin type III domain-containing protein [Phycisphaerae bacterium]